MMLGLPGGGLVAGTAGAPPTPVKEGPVCQRLRPTMPSDPWRGPVRAPGPGVGMYVRNNRSLSDDKELKVRIPIEHHLKLHALKVLTGKPISAAVTEALSAYFEDVFTEGPGTPAPPGAEQGASAEAGDA